MSLRCLLLLSALAALLALIACGGSASPTAGPGESTRETAEVPTETPEVSRRDVLTSLTGRVIVPRYRQASDAMGGLAISVDALCAAPGGASLETARTAWRDARAAWVTTGAFRFGPAMDRRSVSLVDWWPVSIERIEGVVSEGEPVTTETVRQFMPSTQRGMGAMEHLLFGDGSDALAGPAGAMRCGYLEALATVAHDEIDGVRQDWEGDGESPGYDGFFDGSASSSLHPREGEAEVVRSLVFMVRPTCGWGRPFGPGYSLRRGQRRTCAIAQYFHQGATAISTPWGHRGGGGWPGRSCQAVGFRRQPRIGIVSVRQSRVRYQRAAT